jgi:hypothetical protein
MIDRRLLHGGPGRGNVRRENATAFAFRRNESRKLGLMPGLRVKSGTEPPRNSSEASGDVSRRIMDLALQRDLDFPLSAWGPLREFPDHSFEGFGRIPWRAPSACRSSARRCPPNFQRTRLDGSNQAHRSARARPRYLQPGFRFAGPTGLADHGRRPGVPGLD